MPKDKKKKSKKDKRASSAGSTDGVSKNSKDKKKKVKKVKAVDEAGRLYALRPPSQRFAVGNKDFKAEAKEVREKWLKDPEKRWEATRRIKHETKEHLEATLNTAVSALNICGTEGALYLVEFMKAEVDKLKVHLAQDEVYCEDLRFKHQKFHDLLDTSRDFTSSDLQKDLVRNREIQKKCAVLIRGDRDESYKLDEIEMEELVTLRNSLRSWYGGQNTLKGMAYGGGGTDANIFNMKNTDIRVSGSGGQSMQSRFVQSADNPAATGAPVE
jgi:hypothetical protein